MWISTIKVFLQTKDGRFVATETRVQSAIARNGNRVRVLRDPGPSDRRVREFINWPPTET
jgi:hypothetical protein